MLLGSRLTSVTVITLLALAGCAGSSASAVPESITAPSTESSVSVTASSAPTTSPTPRPTPDIAAIGQEYFAFASKLAKAQVAGNAAIDAATSDEELSAAYQLLVDAASQAMDDLGSIELPTDLKDARGTVIASLTLYKQVFAQLVANPNDPDPTIDTRLAEYATKTKAAGAAIRAALGLPPAPN